VKAQLQHRSYPLDEIAARFSHRMVSIHPFANGNGRFSRTIADLLLVQHGAERFTWGAADLVAEGDVRKSYLQALRAADAKDYGPLLAFVRS
jgi:fido (protein-threonine AMPylation protein)